MVLDWYYEFWILSTKTIDYSIDTLIPDGKNTLITLRRIGEIPMPVEIQVTTEKGEQETWYIPLDIMRGGKPANPEGVWIQLEDWMNTAETYEFIIPLKLNRISLVELDPSRRVADVQHMNNVYFVEDHN
jgi:hypothetical protein